MKKWLPALVGLLILVGCVFGARAFIQHSLEENLTTEVVSFAFSATSPVAGQVAVEMQVHNGTRFAGRFERLEGELRVADRPIDWHLSGMQPGDPVAGGETKTLVVTVPLGTADVIGTAAVGILTGRVEATFSGAIVVSAYGLEVPVRVEDRRALTLWERR